MNTVIGYVFTFIIIIILVVLVGPASVILAMVILWLTGYIFNTNMSYMEDEIIDGFDGGETDTGVDTDKELYDPITQAYEETVSQNLLRYSMGRDNATMLDEVLNPDKYSADDKIFNASVISGYKDKKAKDIRSHWNNNNWKKYYDYELGTHEQEHRDWWTNDDFELSKKHILI